MSLSLEEATARERLMAYHAGWKHGASARAQETRWERGAPHIAEEYGRGYSDGTAARIAAGKAAIERLGVDAQTLVLREIGGGQ